MENPYTKTEEDERWQDASFVPFPVMSRWLWFEFSGGALWSSKKRIRELNKYSRDYALPVLRRFVRRFGMRHENYWIKAYDRIEKKYGFGDRAHREFPEVIRKLGVYTKLHHSKVEFGGDHCVCPVCGGTDGYLREKWRYVPGARPGSTITRYGWNEDPYTPLRWLNPEANRFYQFLNPDLPTVDFVCRSSFCGEVRAFLNGSHSLYEKAKKLRVSPNRKSKSREWAKTPEDEFAAGAIGLLDFEARYRERLAHAKNN